MVATIRVALEASQALALMALVGIVSGFATAALTDDTQRSLQVAVGMFAITGAMLSFRLRRHARETGSLPGNATPSHPLRRAAPAPRG